MKKIHVVENKKGKSTVVAKNRPLILSGTSHYFSERIS